MTTPTNEMYIARRVAQLVEHVRDHPREEQEQALAGANWFTAAAHRAEVERRVRAHPDWPGARDAAE